MKPSDVKTLRQLMSLDFPKVFFLSRDLNNPFPSSSQVRNKKKTETDKVTMPSTNNASCCICTHPSGEANRRNFSISPEHGQLLRKLLITGAIGVTDLILCPVCLATVTRLLRLQEEVEEIQSRISAVLKLRSKLEHATAEERRESLSFIPSPDTSRTDHQPEIMHPPPSIRGNEKNLYDDDECVLMLKPTMVAFKNEGESDDEVEVMQEDPYPQEISPFPFNEDTSSVDIQLPPAKDDDDNFEGHKRQHTLERPYIGNKCGKNFALEATAKRHIATAHAMCPKKIAPKRMRKKTEHVCYFCGKMLSRNMNLEHHMRRHTLERPFVCQTCGKDFVVEGYVKKHMATVHAKDSKAKEELLKPKREYQKRDRAKYRHLCDLCGQRFSIRGLLLNHRRNKHNSTEEEKPKPLPQKYQCHNCGKMVLHRRKHQRRCLHT